MRGGQASRSSCRSWDSCFAPLCPLRPNVGLWYAHEPVCRSRKYGAGLEYVRVQRKIARLGGVGGYFTRTDLERVHRVRKGIRGRGPAMPDDDHQNA